MTDALLPILSAHISRIVISPLTKKQASARMESPNCEWEPWLSPLSPKLHSDVVGFVSFLQSRLSSFKQGAVENCEIERKIKQLIRWKNVAQQILSVSMQIDRSSAAKTFVDSFQLAPEAFGFFEAVVSGKLVKVIYPLQSSLKKYKKPISKPLTRTVSVDEETKESEGMFNAGMDMRFEDQRVSFEREGVRNIVTGFVFDKCLRKIERNQENREIFSAFRCDFDLESKQITNIFLNEKYIIKRVGKSVDNNEKVDERLRREFKVQTLLTELKHKNINKIVHYFEDQRNIFAISESAGDKDMLDLLAEYVDNFHKGLSEKLVKKLFRSVVEALLVAHNLGIAHRDVSLENLVFNNYNGAKDEKIEVIDWGHSTSAVPTLLGPMCKYEGPIGKVRYMAPELVFRNSRGGSSDVYDPFKADVFALGVCLFSCLTGQMPFAKVDDSRGKLLRSSAEELILSLNRKAKESRNSSKEIRISRSAMDLLNKCLRWNPEKRCSMEQVLNHEFFAAAASEAN